MVFLTPPPNLIFRPPQIDIRPLFYIKVAKWHFTHHVTNSKIDSPAFTTESRDPKFHSWRGVGCRLCPDWNRFWTPKKHKIAKKPVTSPFFWRFFDPFWTQNCEKTGYIPLFWRFSDFFDPPPKNIKKTLRICDHKIDHFWTPFLSFFWSFFDHFLTSFYHFIDIILSSYRHHFLLTSSFYEHHFCHHHVIIFFYQRHHFIEL